MCGIEHIWVRNCCGFRYWMGVNGNENTIYLQILGLHLVLFRLNNLLHITIFHMKCVVTGNFDGLIQTEYFHFHKTNHSEISTLVTQVFMLLGTGSG